MPLPADVMSAAEIGAKLEIDIRRAQELLRLGVIPGEKVKGRWHILRQDGLNLVINNRKALQELEEEIVAEYWQGYNMARLQERAEEKMEKRGIVAPQPAAIAELTIYAEVMGFRGGVFPKGTQRKAGQLIPRKGRRQDEVRDHTPPYHCRAA